MNYQCSGCKASKDETDFHIFSRTDRHRPVTSKCRECRKEDYYSAKYPDTCGACMKHRKLDINKVCKACNEAMGLRECHVCTAMLPLWMKFYSRSRVCKSCAQKHKEPVE